MYYNSYMPNRWQMQNPMQQQQMQQQMMQQQFPQMPQQPLGLKGRLVSSIEEVRAIPVDRLKYFVILYFNYNYNKADFYYVVNMLYSDFSEVLGNDASVYLKMARAYIDDPDASKEKPYCMWKAKFFV